MAIKLPKYNRQVGTSGEAAGQRSDVGSAGSEWRDLGRLGGAAVEATTDVMNARKEVKAKTDNIGNVTADIKRTSRIKTFNTLADKAISEFAQQKGSTPTDDEVFAINQDLREVLDKDLADIHSQITNPSQLAQYQALDAERNGEAGVVANRASYDLENTKYKVAELDTAGASLIMSGDYAGADAMLDAVKDDIGGTRYLKMQEKFQNLKESHFISTHSSGQTVEELEAQSKMIDEDKTMEDHVKRDAKKANNTVKKQVKAELREDQRLEEVNVSALVADKMTSVPDIRKQIENKTISGPFGQIMIRKLEKDMEGSLPQTAKRELQVFQRKTQKTPSKLFGLEMDLGDAIKAVKDDESLNDDEKYFKASALTKLYGMASNPKIGREVVRAVQEMVNKENFIIHQGVEVSSGWASYSFLNSVTPDMDQKAVMEMAKGATEYLDVLQRDATVMAMGNMDVGADITSESFKDTIDKARDIAPIAGAKRTPDGRWAKQKEDGGWQIWEN